jgi:hypothetical protein
MNRYAMRRPMNRGAASKCVAALMLGSALLLSLEAAAMPVPITSGGILLGVFTQIPEPCTLALCGAGLAWLAWLVLVPCAVVARRRRRGP